jgi:hypothetical protein
VLLGFHSASTSMLLNRPSSTAPVCAGAEHTMQKCGRLATPTLFMLPCDSCFTQSFRLGFLFFLRLGGELLRYLEGNRVVSTLETVATLRRVFALLLPPVARTTLTSTRR